MANPAELLLKEIQAWQFAGNGKSVAETRLYDGKDEGATKYRQLISHIDAISVLLQRMSADGNDVSVYREQVTVWTNIVFAYPDGWKTPNGVDRVAVAHLRTLADRLKSHVFELSDVELGEIRGLINEAAERLDADDSMSEDMKRHVKELLLHAADCVSRFEVVGDVDTQAAVERLFAALGMAIQTSSEEQKNAWQRFINSFKGWTGSATKGAIEAGASGAVQAMLGG